MFVMLLYLQAPVKYVWNCVLYVTFHMYSNGVLHYGTYMQWYCTNKSFAQLLQAH